MLSVKQLADSTPVIYITYIIYYLPFHTRIFFSLFPLLVNSTTTFWANATYHYVLLPLLSDSPQTSLHVFSIACSFFPDTFSCSFQYLHIPICQPYFLFLIHAHSIWTSSLTVSLACTFPGDSLTYSFWYMHIHSRQLYLAFQLLAHSPLTALLVHSDTCTFGLDNFATFCITCIFNYLQIQRPRRYIGPNSTE